MPYILLLKIMKEPDEKLGAKEGNKGMTRKGK